MNVLDLIVALSEDYWDTATVTATTPHGSYTFTVSGVEQTPDGPRLRLEPIDA